VGLSLLAFALNGLEELNFSTAAFCRQRDGWAYLAGLLTVSALGPLKSQALAVLCFAAAASAVLLSTCSPEPEVLLRQHRAKAAAGTAGGLSSSKAPWPPKSDITATDSLAVGLLGGGLLVLHQLYLSSVEAPAALCFADAAAAVTVPTWIAFGLGGLFVLLPTSWRREQVVLLSIFAAPLVASVLQLLPPQEAPGVGQAAFFGLNLLFFSFPSMLVVFVQRLADVARSGYGGCAVFLALGLWVSTIAMRLVPFLGTTGGPQQRLQDPPVALLASSCWLLGMASGGANVKDDKARRTARRDAFAVGGSLILAAAVVQCGLVAFWELRADAMQAKTFPDTALTVAQMGLQQARENTAACSFEALGSADIVGLRGRGGPDVAGLHAKELQFLRYSGVPGSAASGGRAVLSRAKLHNVTANWQAVSKDQPTWVRAWIAWGGQHVQFYSVELHQRGDLTAQFDELAKLLREDRGPAIVVGSFALPADVSAQRRKDLRSLVEGAALQDAFAATDPGVKPQLLRTFKPDLPPADHVFYRGLDVAEARVDTSVQCAEHVPMIVKFRLPSSEFEVAEP